MERLKTCDALQARTSDTLLEWCSPLYYVAGAAFQCLSGLYRNSWINETSACTNIRTDRESTTMCAAIRRLDGGFQFGKRKEGGVGVSACYSGTKHETK